MTTHLPKDPIILLSTVNAKLRDHHKTLDDLCKTYFVEPEHIIETLSTINYFYDPKSNQFK